MNNLRYLLLLSTMLGAPQALAQKVQDASDSSGSLHDSSDIVVTARRREESLTDVPVSVTAFDDETLRNQQVFSIGDLNKITPGLSVTYQLSKSGAFFTIRGNTKTTSGVATPGVQVYLNEVPMASATTIVPTFDVANIQVLKGAQGTLFGQNAVGGAVLYYSAPAIHKLEGYGEARYGNYDSLALEGAINLPVVPDVLAVRVSGLYDHTDGFLKTVAYSARTQAASGVQTPGLPIGGINVGDSTSKAVRGSIRFEPSDRIKNDTVIDYTEIDGVGATQMYELFPQGQSGGSPALVFRPPAVLAAALGPLIGGNLVNLFQCTSNDPGCNVFAAFAAQQAAGPRTTFTDLPAQGLQKILGVSNTTTVGLGDALTLKNIFGYRWTRSRSTGDLDGTALPYLDIVGQSNLRVITEELQLSGQVGERLKFVVGGFYYDLKPTGLGGFNTSRTIVFGGLSNSLNTLYLHDRSKALYGQIDYDLSSLVAGLGVTVGFRQNWDDRSGCSVGISYSPVGGEGPGRLDFVPSERECRSGTLTTVAPGATSSTAQQFETSFRKSSYNLSLNWKPDDDILVYLTTRTGYRAGGFNIPTLAPAYSSLQFFKPETVTDYEIGAKTKWNAGPVRGLFEVAVFRNENKDRQSLQITTGIAGLPSSGIITNKANIRFQGFEANLNASVGGLSFGANVAHVDPKIRKLTVPPALTAAFQSAGVVPPVAVELDYISRWQFNTNAGYEASLGEIGTLAINANLHYQSSFEAGTLHVPSYTTVDGQVALKDIGGAPLDLRLYVRNLFDKTYVAGPGISSSVGLTSVFYGPPRTYGIAMRYRFGS